MTSNPMRPYGGNYSAPTSDFSRYTGSSFPSMGSNFYPPNPSVPLTNPYSTSSIGVYSNATFSSVPPPSFQPSFSFSSLPGSVTSPSIPSYSRPSPSFNPNPPLGRSSEVKPQITHPGSTPAWVATMQPSSLFNPPHSDYRINNSPSIPSFALQPFSPTVPSFQPRDSFLFHTIEPQRVSSPPNYLGTVPFSQQLPSGLAGLPSTYSSLGGTSFLPSRGHSWTPPTSSSHRDPFSSDRAIVQWTPGHLSSYGQSLPSVEKDLQFQFKMLRKFEETARFMYQMHASPEKPFARWDTMIVAPVAIQINPQTTLFIDPFNISDFFQRVTARAQETRATQDNPLRAVGQAIAIIHSTETQSMAKYVGIFVKNTLITIEELNGSSKRLSSKMNLSQAWETEAVPAMHQAIDNAYGTNLGAGYNPNNDGRVQQFIQNAVLDPLVLLPWGRIAKAINLSIPGAQFTIKEIGSAIKTARVGLEAPLAMKPAFATVGNMMAKEAHIAIPTSVRVTQVIPAKGKVLINFTDVTAKRLSEEARRIPMQILDNIIKFPTAVVKDPKGTSNAVMYYSQIWKNKKLYNAEVLYDKKTNTILHFQYTQKAIGPLHEVSK